MMFLCWLKAIGLILAVLATVAGIFVAFCAAMFCIVGACIAIGDFFERHPVTRLIPTLGKALLILLVALSLVGGVWGAKQQVCKRGFVRSYKDFIADMFK
jgi:predicted PurR-regulated permease PerM